MDMKRFFLYAIAIAALALAGCGGNGGGGTAMMPDTPTTTPPTTTPPTTTPPTCLEDPAAANCTGPTAEDMAAAAVAATKAAATKTMAIGVSAGQTGTTDEGLGGMAADQTTDPVQYSFTIARDRDGTEVKITDTGMNNMDDPKFATVRHLDEANGFAGTMNVRTQEAGDDGSVEQEVIVIRTDIAAPKATKFSDVHPLTTSTNTDNDSPAPTNEALRITTANGGMLMSAAFVSAGSETTLKFDSAVTASQDVAAVKAFETMASFNGAMGTLTCGGGTDCTVTLNEKGEVIAVSEEWNFTPGTGATVDVADANYLTYGIWLKRTTKDGATTYNEVEAFTQAMGDDLAATTPTDIDTVVGSAKYMGNSTGVYVKNVTDNTGAITSSTSGLYSALVNLTASFGGGDIADNNKFTIDGEVTDFSLEKGEENDWGVKLGLADFGNRAAGDAPGKTAPASSGHTNMFSGVATGDSTAVAGSWNGMFYGDSASGNHDMDDTTPDTSPQPIAVLGEFNANFTDGAVLGGFGANKQ